MESNLKSVIWITGNSSAGKTTVARNLQAMMTADYINCVFLDGDDLRSILSQKWGYDHNERLELAKTYLQLASHISSQGNVVIISAVAMFNEIFTWFKENVENPILVYLDVPLQERIARDEGSKGVYAKLKNQNVKYDIPTDPNLIIKNYGALSPEMSAQLIKDYIKNKTQNKSSDKGRTKHWNEFYVNGNVPQYPSPFAEWVSSNLSEQSRIIDIGCGNGRDSFYFHSLGHTVTGIDVSESAIRKNNEKIPTTGLDFIWNDLTNYGSHKRKGKVDVIYSRFSIHAMTEEEESATINSASLLLKRGGVFYIETRSIKDTLAKKGELISHSERIEGHYRRFGDSKKLVKKLENNSFSVEHLVENNGLAIYKNEDPIVIRIKAKKL